MTGTLVSLCAVWSSLAVGAGPTAVKVQQADDGSVTVVTQAYQVRLGPGGCLQSIRAGDVEFLGKHSKTGASSGMPDYIKPGHYGVLHPEMTFEKFGRPQVKPKGVVSVSGPQSTLTYRFRQGAFDLVLKAKPNRKRFLLFPSKDVVRSLDLVTDRAIRLGEDRPIGWTQEGMRWVTRQGVVLRVDERVDGYASAYWWAGRAKGAWPGVSLYVGRGVPTYTFRPIAAPTPADALQFVVRADDPNFLLPGGRPVRFDVRAINVAATPQQATVDFEVRDYATRKVVGRTTTQLALAPQATQPVKAEVAVKEPGVYRGVVVVKQGDKTMREVAWVFVYDFPNYKPALTRQPDFRAFWKETLDELARVPMDPKLKLNEKWSSKTHELYEVSLATLGGERFWAWYSKPRKPGRYPVIYRCPPTGPFHPHPGSGNRSRGAYCHFYIAIHGFDLYLSDRDPTNAKDPRNRYQSHGLQSPKTARWRTIFASLARGMDFLRSRPEVDPKRIGATGSSQGGGLAIVLAGLQPDVAFCAPTCAGLCRLDWTVVHKVGYWPFIAHGKPKDHTMDRFLKTISYFDAANFAPDIRCPLVSHCQLLDWVTTSGGQVAAFAQLKPGQIELIGDPWQGHGGRSPDAGRRYAQAMARFLKGQAPIVKPSK